MHVYLYSKRSEVLSPNLFEIEWRLFQFPVIPLPKKFQLLMTICCQKLVRNLGYQKKKWLFQNHFGPQLFIYIHPMLGYVNYGKPSINFVVKSPFVLVDNEPIPQKWTEAFIEKLLGEGDPKPRFSIEPRVGRSVG